MSFVQKLAKQRLTAIVGLVKMPFSISWDTNHAGYEGLGERVATKI